MKIIELTNGYFIEIDELNHTLKQRYDGKSRDGADKEAVKIVGFYSNIDLAISAYIRYRQIDSPSFTGVQMKEYVNQVKKSNDEAVKAIKKMLEGKI